jgi:hypothetical protein
MLGMCRSAATVVARLPQVRSCQKRKGDMAEAVLFDIMY